MRAGWAAAALLLGVLGTGAPALAGGSTRSLTPPRLVGVVNLNEASATQLELLPGVGARASAGILQYRQRQRFGRVEELVRVKGFGKKRFARLRPLLTVQGPTTLRVETSTGARPARP